MPYHLYRAAPAAQSSSLDESSYLMYGLLTVAVVLGLMIVYRMYKKRHDHEMHKDDEVHPTPGKVPNMTPAALGPTPMPRNPMSTPMATPMAPRGTPMPTPRR